MDDDDGIFGPRKLENAPRLAILRWNASVDGHRTIGPSVKFTAEFIDAIAWMGQAVGDGTLVVVMVFRKGCPAKTSQIPA